MGCIWLTTLAVILSLTFSSVVTDTCKQLNGVSYVLKTDWQTWNDASAACKSIGGKLAEIETAEENELLRNMAKESGVTGCWWLGGTDADKEGSWKWAGSGTCMGAFTDWAKGQPNNDKGYISPGGLDADCLDLLSEYDYHWNDGACDKKCQFLCETSACP